ncbi:spore coat CotO family protein [Bacillus piscicola]|uniref:spore coat CotO family protein n=1 Tax=Bacillus piscicola TaxID=1632684 RepID=UPI001F08BA6C|nr:spore coat CotO family protein [Bacillus piscicola]
MEKDNAEGQPLYYIDQPVFNRTYKTGQTVAVRKHTKGRPKLNKKKEKEKKKPKMKDKMPPLNETRDDYLDQTQKKSPKVDEQEKETTEKLQPRDDNRPLPKVKETFDYLQTIPHYIQPVVVCETEEGQFRGVVLRVTGEEMEIEEEDQLTPSMIHINEMIDLYIVSL